MRIGVIHATLNAVEPLVRALKEADSNIEACNYVNEELLFHANQAGGVDDWGLRNFYRLFMQAAESAVDGIIIACSLYSAYAQEASKLTGKPVIAIDQPMIEEAVAFGEKIGILATTSSAGPVEEMKILKQAEKMGRDIKTQVLVRPDAFSALKNGNKNRHNEILKEAAQELKKLSCDTIVLSQITMACAKKEIEELGIKVLSSPDSGANWIISCINDR